MAFICIYTIMPSVQPGVLCPDSGCWPHFAPADAYPKMVKRSPAEEYTHHVNTKRSAEGAHHVAERSPGVLCPDSGCSPHFAPADAYPKMVKRSPAEEYPALTHYAREGRDWNSTNYNSTNYYDSDF